MVYLQVNVLISIEIRDFIKLIVEQKRLNENNESMARYTSEYKPR